MNSASCGGIFVEQRDLETGGFKTSSLPDLDARMEHATLRSANGHNGQPGQKILTVPVKQQTQQFYGPHFNPTALKRGGSQIAGFKAIDNSNSVVYLRREIWIGQKPKKK